MACRAGTRTGSGHTWDEERIWTDPLPMMIEKAPARDEAAANCFSPLKGTMLLPVMLMLRWSVSVAPGATLPAVPLPASAQRQLRSKWRHGQVQGGHHRPQIMGGCDVVP